MVLLLPIAAATTGASASALDVRTAVTVSYRGVGLDVPLGWTIERYPTRTAGTTALRVSSPPPRPPVEWVVVGEIARVARPARTHLAVVYPGGPRVGITHIVVHGLDVAELSGPGVLRDHLQWTVASLDLAIWGVGPDVSRVPHTLHRSG